MLIESDPQTGGTYFVLTDRSVVRTHHLSDLVMVDLDAEGEVVGFELAMRVPDITGAEWRGLFDAYPMLKELLPPDLLDLP